MSGDELARRALARAKRFGAEILVTRKVVAVDPETRELELDGNELVCAKTVILAIGVSWRKVEIDDCRAAEREGRLLRGVAE